MLLTQISQVDFPILTNLHSPFSITMVLGVIFVSFKQFDPVVRKPAFCICENKDADQLRGNLEADQRLCFRYTDSTIPLLP